MISRCICICFVLWFFCFTEFVTCFGCDSSFGFYIEHVQEAFLASSWRESVMSSERAGPGNHAFSTDPRPLAFLHDRAQRRTFLALRHTQKRRDLGSRMGNHVDFFLQLIDQFQHVKIQSKTKDLSKSLRGINPTNSALNNRSLKSIVLG